MRGAIVWLTGLSGAGKSTIAHAVAERLHERRAVEVLDGDELRAQLSAGLGFSRADRDVNVHRIGYVARLLAKHGVLVLVAAIAPYAETRAALRTRAEQQSLAFLEVYVDAPLEVVSARDVKGLYRKARAGEVSNLTGVSDPYEPPPRPDLAIASGTETVAESVERLLALLATHRLS
jgi:adenylyl-sulfate kinase